MVFDLGRLYLGMKKTLTFAFILVATLSFGQSFHFVDTTTTLVKTTDQSPAHWYIEVYNDVQVDTLLRWKASFSNIPAAWQISFDDQSNYYTNVLDGDSADFVLLTGLSFPQKLIIGGTLNGTPGVGSVYFDIYDPVNPTNVQRIEYHFVITQWSASIIEITSDNWVLQKENIFVFNNNIIGDHLVIYSVTGEKLYDGTIESNMNFPMLSNHGVVYFVMENNGEFKSAKFLFE